VLIAIHGGPGMSSDYMIGLEQLAGPDLAVVTYDQRGTGRSTSPPANASSYDLLQYVADLEAVRQAVGAEQVYLFGHSWGGVVAMRYATVHPQRVRAIVLMGSGPPSAEAARAGQVRLARRIARLQEQGIIPQRISALEEILLAYIADPGAGLPDALRDLDYNATVEQLTWAALDDYDFTAEVARLDCPVLMLWGESDPFGLPMAEATRSALSAAGERTRSPVEFVLLQGCGHFWHECPDAFFGQVRSFLDRAADPAV
jgi:proline iminopeptidase